MGNFISAAGFEKTFKYGQLIWQGLVITVLLALLTVVLGFVLFNAVDLNQAIGDVAGMFGFGGVPLFSNATWYYLRSYGVVLILAIVGSTPLIRNAVVSMTLQEKRAKIVSILEPVVLIALLLLCTAYLVDGSFNPFLYFRF